MSYNASQPPNAMAARHDGSPTPSSAAAARAQLLAWADEPPGPSIGERAVAGFASAIGPKVPLILGAAGIGLLVKMLWPKRKTGTVGRVVSLSLLINLVKLLTPFITMWLKQKRTHLPFR